MSLNRETELRIAGLEWQEFEQLVFDLAFAEHPGAVKTIPPDLGADTLVFDDGEHGRDVFQAKNYRERIRWDACVESLDASLAYSPARVTFVFPRDLTGSETKTFDKKLRQRHEGVAIDLWSLSTLRALLDKHPHVLVGGLPANLSRVLDSLQPKALSANAIDRLLDQFGSRRSRLPVRGRFGAPARGTADHAAARLVHLDPRRARANADERPNRAARGSGRADHRLALSR